MVLELIATLCTGLFTGAAIYVNLVEHPARLEPGIGRRGQTVASELSPRYRDAGEPRRRGVPLVRRRLASRSRDPGPDCWFANRPRRPVHTHCHLPHKQTIVRRRPRRWFHEGCCAARQMESPPRRTKRSRLPCLRASAPSSGRAPLTRKGAPPNKRLKLAGGDRFKGNGVLCARAHELSFQ